MNADESERNKDKNQAAKLAVGGPIVRVHWRSFAEQKLLSLSLTKTPRSEEKSMIPRRRNDVAIYSVVSSGCQIYASKYLQFLPSEEELRIEIHKERRLIEAALEERDKSDE